MSMKAITYVLWGFYAGASILLGRFKFTDGQIQLTGTEDEHKKLAHFLAINWQAFPEGHPQLKEKYDGISYLSPPGEAGQLQSDNLPNGSGSEEDETGDGKQPAGAETGTQEQLPSGDGSAPGINEKLAAAVASLDPKDDDHWTADGKPAMKAVEALYGSTAITRADVEAVAPGFVRPKVDEKPQG